MRALLDECLPRRLRRELPGHDVRTVPEVGWAGLSDGVLLERSAERFDAFVTVDRNLTFQQNLSHSRIAVVVLAAGSNEFEVLARLVPDLVEILPRLRPGDVVRIER